MSAKKSSRAGSHYDLLGVSQAATSDEIADANAELLRLYEARSKQNDSAATDVLRLLNEAYTALSDEHKRAVYDREPRVLAESYVDVAYSLPIGRYAKLQAMAAWMADSGMGEQMQDIAINDVLRERPLLDGADE
jgi:curved DNA-binding protein CbpA